jgi:hypothetical protein
LHHRAGKSRSQSRGRKPVAAGHRTRMGMRSPVWSVIRSRSRAAKPLFSPPSRGTRASRECSSGHGKGWPMGMRGEAWAARVPCPRRGTVERWSRGHAPQGCCVFGSKRLANHFAQMRNLPGLWAWWPARARARHNATVPLAVESNPRWKPTWPMHVCTYLDTTQ